MKLLIALCAAILLAGVATADPPAEAKPKDATWPPGIRFVQHASTSSGLDGCLRAIPGLRIAQPNSNGWSTALTIWNLRLPRRSPVVVVYPKTVTQVSKAVKCARKYSRKVVPRGGGHSYEGELRVIMHVSPGDSATGLYLNPRILHCAEPYCHLQIAALACPASQDSCQQQQSVCHFWKHPAAGALLHAATATALPNQNIPEPAFMLSHSGFGVQDGKVIVDLSAMASVKLSADRKTASIGAGAKLGPIYKALWDQGKKGLPAGTCPAVGIGGHIQGGGQGLTARMYGLASDRLVAVQVVDYSGKIINASAKQNADLLWACKGGGGGNFGIAVRFTIVPSSPPQQVVLLTLTWPMSQLSGAIKWYQTKMPKLPNGLSSDLFIGFGSIQLHGLWLGSRSSLDKVLAGSSLNSIVGNPSSSDIRTMPYINAMAELANQAMSMTPNTPASLALGPGVKLAPRGAFKAKSSFIVKPNSAAGIGVIASWLQKAQSSGIDGWIQYHAFGGALNKPKTGDTAFPYRNTLGNAQFYVGWGNSAEAKRSTDWINGFYAAMKPHQSSGTYINYIDKDLGSSGLTRYYASNLKRLVAIKKKYDPTNFFNYPGSIPTLLPA